jgi:hypothetical protein
MTTIDSIWWQPYNRSINKLSLPDKRRIQKFINNKLPTLWRNEKYYGCKSYLFPCCCLYTETEDHIIQCRIPTSQRKWRKVIIGNLTEQRTPEDVKYTICHGFFNWLESSRKHEFKHPRRIPDFDINSVVSIQQSIGWDHFVRGNNRMGQHHQSSYIYKTNHQAQCRRLGNKTI